MAFYRQIINYRVDFEILIVMCTVTYIPKENSEFILTHNRDEDIKRAIATPPIEKLINGEKHLLPIDPQGGGTWIGISETGRVASLLNGGSESYNYNPPYRHSRGKVILDYFSCPDFISFYNSYNFNELEPFTLLVFEDNNMFELIVNESNISMKELDVKKPHIYSSSSLYTDKSKEERRLSFFEWFYKTQNISQETAMKFHHNFLFEKEKDKSKIWGDYILNTVSITSVYSTLDKAEIHYSDQFNDIQLKKVINIKKPVLVHLD